MPPVRKDFLNRHREGQGQGWYQREAMRAVNQTLGRVIRHRALEWLSELDPKRWSFRRLVSGGYKKVKVGYLPSGKIQGFFLIGNWFYEIPPSFQGKGSNNKSQTWILLSWVLWEQPLKPKKVTIAELPGRNN